MRVPIGMVGGSSFRVIDDGETFSNSISVHQEGQRGFSETVVCKLKIINKDGVLWVSMTPTGFICDILDKELGGKYDDKEVDNAGDL